MVISKTSTLPLYYTVKLNSYCIGTNT